MYNYLTVLKYISFIFFLQLFIFSHSTLAQSNHFKAEKLWQQGQDLYEKGQIKAALEKFKESFKLEPNPDKGSYLAWLISEMEYEENINTKHKIRCYLAQISNSPKFFGLSDDWIIKVDKDGSLSFFRKSFPFYPTINIINNKLSYKKHSQIKKYFNLFINKFSSNFHIKNPKLENIKSLNIYTAELLPKDQTNIYSKFYLVPDNKNLYGVILSTQKNAISQSTINTLHQIIFNIAGKNPACNDNANVNRAPYEIQKTKSEINKVISDE